jgi:FkbM family methyltransferase
VRLALAGRVHQYPEILALRRFLSAFAVDCVFDVGANYGQYATTLRKDAGFRGTILSFEPNPDVFTALSRRAGSDPKWHVFNMALSDFDGTAAFNIMAAHQFSSLERPAETLDAVFVDRNKVERTVDMQCRRLDGMMEELRAAHGFARPFLKMDTQGHDRSVCEGAAGVLDDMLGLQTELAVRPLYDGATGYRAMIDWLGERGFVPSAFFANNKGHFPLLVEMDGIFLNQHFLPEQE